MPKSLEQFIEAISAQGCRYHEIVGKYGPWGPPRSCYITRSTKGGTLVVPLPNIANDDTLCDDVINSLLRSLHLDPNILD